MNSQGGNILQDTSAADYKCCDLYGTHSGFSGCPCPCRSSLAASHGCDMTDRLSLFTSGLAVRSSGVSPGRGMGRLLPSTVTALLQRLEFTPCPASGILMACLMNPLPCEQREEDDPDDASSLRSVSIASRVAGFCKQADIKHFWFILNKTESREMKSLIMKKLANLRDRVSGMVTCDRDMIAAALSAAPPAGCNFPKDVEPVLEERNRRLLPGRESCEAEQS